MGFTKSTFQECKRTTSEYLKKINKQQQTFKTFRLYDNDLCTYFVCVCVNSIQFFIQYKAFEVWHNCLNICIIVNV